MKPALLLEIKRNNIVEKQHFGFVIVVDKNENIVFKIGDDENKKFWLRSASKPFQASLIIKSGAYEKFRLTLDELAVCCASHAGTDEHIKRVKSVLNKIGLSESHLKCGASEPLDKESMDFLIKNNLKPSPVHNNCSGKHAGMLAVCMANNLDVENYLDFNHPHQKEIKKTVAEFCNYDEKDIETGRDGCLAPVHSMPHCKAGVGYLNIFSDKDYRLIKEAFQQYPVLIGGNDRLDTEIIKASSGKLVSKVAAEGLCITISPEQEKAVIVKILDADIKARSIVTAEILKHIDMISGEESEKSL